MDEPSIYDYLRSLFSPEAHNDLKLAAKKAGNEKANPETDIRELDPDKRSLLIFILSCLMAVLGQYFLEPDHKYVILAAILYLISTVAIFRGWSPKLAAHKQKNVEMKEIRVKYGYFYLSLALQVGAFIFFKGNTFTILNTSLWVGGIIFLYLAFKDDDQQKMHAEIKLDPKIALVIILIVCASVFMRVYRLNEVPAEMYSDHAEKLLDVMDIMDGTFPIFFERNTGREPIQFYMTALIVKIFNTGFTFTSLKVGTIAFGLLTLPFIYLLGKDIGNYWIGLIAVFLTGTAYWPNVISRVGLRYSLYPLFTAPALYFLFKGMREKNINAIMLCGIFTGFGLLGYSSFRIMPIFIVVAAFIYLVSNRDKSQRIFAVNSLLLIGLVAFAVFLPLARYSFDNPGALSYRSISRLTQVEKPFDEPALFIFFKNSITSLLMPILNNGHIWVHSIPNRPALDFVTGAFYFIGLVQAYKSTLKGKHIEISLLILSIFVLMLPSILSLAYPGENPSLNRSAAAYIPVFIFSGFGFYAFLEAVRQVTKPEVGKITSVIAALIIGIIVIVNNFSLVFNAYSQQFLQNAWNTSEIGEVVGEFLESGDNENEAYVIPYPHWVDTRLVGFNAGYPGTDFALWREDIEEQVDAGKNNLFIYKPEDVDTENVIKDLFPSGELSVFYSHILGKEFFIYTVLENK